MENVLPYIFLFGFKLSSFRIFYGQIYFPILNLNYFRQIVGLLQFGLLKSFQPNPFSAETVKVYHLKFFNIRSKNFEAKNKLMYFSIKVMDGNTKYQ